VQELKIGQRFGRLVITQLGVRVPTRRHTIRAAVCLCDCGAVKTVRVNDLTRKPQGVRSCGCLRREVMAANRIDSNDPRVHAWHKSAEGRARLSEVARTSENAAHMARIARTPENRARLQSPEWQAHLARIAKLNRVHGLSKHPLYDSWWQMMNRCYNEKAKSYKNYGGRGITVCPEWHDVRNYVAWIEANLGSRPEGLTLDRVNNDGNYEPGNMRWATYSEQNLNRRKRIKRR
jgi:hypothetical protein